MTPATAAPKIIDQPAWWRVQPHQAGEPGQHDELREALGDPVAEAAEEHGVEHGPARQGAERRHQRGRGPGRPGDAAPHRHEIDGDAERDGDQQQAPDRRLLQHERGRPERAAQRRERERAWPPSRGRCLLRGAHHESRRRSKGRASAAAKRKRLVARNASQLARSAARSSTARCCLGGEDIAVMLRGGQLVTEAPDLGFGLATHAPDLGCQCLPAHVLLDGVSASRSWRFSSSAPA